MSSARTATEKYQDDFGSSVDDRDESQLHFGNRLQEYIRIAYNSIARTINDIHGFFEQKKL